MYKYMNEYKNVWINYFMREWINERMNEWMNKRWINEWIIELMRNYGNNEKWVKELLAKELYRE